METLFKVLVVVMIISSAMFIISVIMGVERWYEYSHKIDRGEAIETTRIGKNYGRTKEVTFLRKDLLKLCEGIED